MNKVTDKANARQAFLAVRFRLLEKQVSQRQLASALGISPSYLSQLIHCRRYLTGALRAGIAATLGCKEADLFGRPKYRRRKSVGVRKNSCDDTLRVPDVL